MRLSFNVTGDSRKAMVAAIEKETGKTAHYNGVPTCSYEVGRFMISRTGELIWTDLDDADPEVIKETSAVIDACVLATGVSPAEWGENLPTEPMEGERAEEKEPEGERVELTVTIPLEKVDMGNLISLLEAKGDLIKKALGIGNVHIEEKDETVTFPWFSEVAPDEALAYTKFISALCEMSIKQKRISAKAKETDNDKYAFRCFLLRLGFIGNEYKADRKILLKNLDGSSAFKSGAKKGGEQ